MKKQVRIMCLFSLLLVFVSCGTSANSEPVDYSTYVDRYELEAIEDGWAYYGVYLGESVDWAGDDMYTKQEPLADYIILQCRELALTEDVENYWVMGYESNGALAFSWDGGDKIRYYKNNMISYEMNLLQEQITAFNL